MAKSKDDKFKAPKKRVTLTMVERQEAVSLVVGMISLGAYKHHIKAALRSKFGSYGRMSARTCSDYIARARDALHNEFRGLSLEQLQEGSLAFYNRAVGNRVAKGEDKVKWPERLRARERMDKLLGLEPPQQVNVGGEITMVHIGEAVARMKQRGLWEQMAPEAREQLEASIAESNGEAVDVTPELTSE